MYRKPVAAKTKPGTVNSKKENCLNPKSAKELDIRRFVLDPSNVVMPPSIATKLKGIINALAEREKRSARICIMGIKITTTGVLFRKALIIKTKIRAKTMEKNGFFGLSPTTNCVARSKDLVLTIACPITRSDNTVIKAGLEKPAKILEGLKRLFPSASR